MDYDWLALHLGIKIWIELRRAKAQLKDAHEELKQLGYISDYHWDGWRIVYRPGPIWKGEQLRRKSGKSCQRAAKPAELVKSEKVTMEPSDPLIPALAAFASGLSVGEERIKALGLTVEQARVLCKEKQLPLHNR